MTTADPFERWVKSLEERHLADLSFAEVRRAVQALSSLYVERRTRMTREGAFGSSGKRAAYALFYGPVHFLVVSRLIRALDADSPPPSRILDLGCGTGAAGAAWATETGGRPTLLGIDRSGWAVSEARWTYGSIGLRARARRADVTEARLPGKAGAVVAAYTVNELDASTRDVVLDRLLAARARGARILVVEPISRRVSPWWQEWSEAVEAADGTARTWRFSIDLPEPLRLLDRAAGLDHRELTCRSLWLGAGSR